MTTTTTEERKLVLEMLADGKINVEDAQRLLDKLQDIEGSKPQAARSKPAGTRPKHIRIQTTSDSGDDELNLRIPLGLVRAGLALESFFPSWIHSKIIVGSSDFDMTKLDSDYLRENLDELDLTFDSNDGESLHIFAE